MGMVDMHGLDGAQGGPRLFCVPEQITLAQMVRVVVRYLNRHQEDLHESGIVLATRAFTQVFPCPESPAPAPGRE